MIMKKKTMEINLKRYAIPAFVTWLVSVLCYLPFIAKGLTNSVDGLWAPTYYQSGNIELGCGRWMLLFLDKGRGAYAAEPFSSFLALFFVSIAVYVCIDMFTEINYKTIVYGILIPCSTTICCYLAYRFTSANYSLAVLLSSIGAWLVTRDIDDKKKSIIRVLFAIALMVSSLGIYQANLGCFCILIIVFMMKLLIDGENQKCLGVFIRTVIVGVASCIIYKIAWDLCLMARHVTASNYNGADSVSISSMIIGLPHSLRMIYRAWLSYFLFQDGYYVFTYIRVLIVVFIFALVVIIGAKRLRGDLRSLIIYIILCLCLPFGANIAVVLAPSALAVMKQMTAPMMMVVPILLYFVDGIEVKYNKIICILGALLLYGNIYAVGTDIEAMVQGSNTTYAIMNNIVVSLNEKNLLGDEYEYAFYGNPEKNELFRTNELYQNASNYAKFGKLQTKTDMMRNAYMGLFDDIGINMQSVEFDTYKEVLDSEVLNAMPAFPADDSIIEKDGVVVVKVSEDYK